jgi:hypothetical protein
MPRLRYTGGSRYALRDGPTWEDGDVHEVNGATADRLAELDKFELVDGNEDNTTTGTDICGAEQSAGGTCDRPADECPYHDADDKADGDT